MVLGMLVRIVSRRSMRLGSLLGAALWTARAAEQYRRFSSPIDGGKGESVDRSTARPVAVAPPVPATQYEWWADD